MGHGYAKCPQNLALSNTWTQQLECQKWESVNFLGIVLQYHLTCKMALQHYAKTKQYILIRSSPSIFLSLQAGYFLFHPLSRTIVKLLFFSLNHQATMGIGIEVRLDSWASAWRSDSQALEVRSDSWGLGCRFYDL